MNTPATPPPAAGEAAHTPLVSSRALFFGKDSICLHTTAGDTNPFLCRITSDVDNYEAKAVFVETACNSYAALKAKADRCAELEGALVRAVGMLETAANRISTVSAAGGIDLASKIMRERDRARALLAKSKEGGAS